MAKAKKLPSGSWRVQVFSHRDANGKIHMESFTAPSKEEANMLASEYAATKKRRARCDLTVGEAIDGYIKAKEGVLSPSTIRGYDRMVKQGRFDSIKGIKLKKLTSENLQLFISDLSQKYKAKTARNAYGLLHPAISMYAPDLAFRVTLPKKEKVKKTSPSDEDIKELFQQASTEMQKCIVLSAFGSMRRGEICALKYRDLKGNEISIHADVVQNKDNKWVFKEMPKTAESVRTLYFHDNVIRLLGEGDPEQFIVGYANPGSITGCFVRLRNRIGFPEIRFHDLRAYYASIAAVLGIPSVYLSEMGGWRKDSPVMKEVYQNQILPMSEYYAKKIAEHSSGII